MKDPFTASKSSLQPSMSGKNRLFPTALTGTNPASFHFWLRSGLLLWFGMKLNQTLFGFPAPIEFIKLEAAIAWNEHLRGGLLWLVQHL